ncbi:hypothetical protein [Bacillus amyloliquefaciens]|uniref:hypothetical protein n=1 Tax=Bacillus amyloliquefaciens TaxID=1390 RepID=UPI000E26F2BA|nr:hypothetical protein [Bacillus amyloliquefaciens]RDY83121.1 hypothetical protein C3733_19860 [Bacillus amyloliquefaciens]
MKTRANVSWRIAKMKDQEKLNQWCNAQSNIEQSLTNLVLHMIDIVGYKDIRDFETQQQIYELKMGSAAPKTLVKKDESQATSQFIDNSSVVDELTDEKDTADPEDDIFNDLDPDNQFWRED